MQPDVYQRDTPGLPRQTRWNLKFYSTFGFFGVVVREVMAYLDALETQHMTVSYELTVNALCPADDKPDTYETTVRANQTIPVEAILAAAAKYRGQKLFQEDLTADLARTLGAEVETVGWHSGVRVVCNVGQRTTGTGTKVEA